MMGNFRSLKKLKKINSTQKIEDISFDPGPYGGKILEKSLNKDKVAASLTEGKLGIIVDNTPYQLIVPTGLNDLMHAPDDYYQRWLMASTVRLTRFIGTFAALILPSFYIAMVSYHPQIIPTELALSIAFDREAIPMPAFLEAFLMEGVFELMGEAGTRLPGNLGQTVGVVGTVVIGQAAVTANIASPDYSHGSWRILR